MVDPLSVQSATGRPWVDARPRRGVPSAATEPFESTGRCGTSRRPRKAVAALELSEAGGVKASKNVDADLNAVDRVDSLAFDLHLRHKDEVFRSHAAVGADRCE